MDSKKEQLKAAKELIVKGQFGDALTICKSILNEDSQNYLALVFAGRCNFELLKFNEAAAMYDKAVLIDSGQGLAIQGLIQLYEKQDLVDKLIPNYVKLIGMIRDEPKLKTTKLSLARAYSKVGRFDDAGKEFMALLEQSMANDEKERLFAAISSACREQKAYTSDSFVRAAAMGFEMALSLPVPDEQNLQFCFRFLRESDSLDDVFPLLVKLFGTGDGVENNAVIVILLAESLLTFYALSGGFQEDNEELIEQMQDRVEDGTYAAWLVDALQTLLTSDPHERAESLQSVLQTPHESAPVTSIDCLNVAVARTYMQMHRGAEALNFLKPRTKSVSFLSSVIDYLSIVINIECEEITGDLLNRNVSILRKMVDKPPPNISRDQILFTIAEAFIAASVLDNVQSVLTEVTDKDGSKYHEIAGWLHFLTGNNVNAASELQRASELDGSNVSAVVRYGRVLWASGEHGPSTLKLFLQAAKLDPYNVQAFLFMGHYYVEAGTEDKAVKCYERASELDATNVEVGKALSDLYHKLGAQAKNVNLLQRIVDNTVPNNEFKWAWLRYGLGQMGAQDFDGAVNTFQRLTRYHQNDVAVWECLAEGYQARGSYESAAKAFKNVVALALITGEMQTVTFARYQIACVDLAAERFEEAIIMYSAVLDANSDYFPALLGKGEALFGQAKVLWGDSRFLRSFEVCNECFALCGRALAQDQQTSSAWKLYGDLCTFLDRYSVDCLQRLNASNVVDIYEWLGKQAVEAYQKTVELKPDAPSCLYDLGLAEFRVATRITVIAEREICMSKAVDCLKQALAINPADTTLWNALGVVFSNCAGDEKIALAQHCFAQALSINQKLAHVWTNAGFLNLQQGDAEIAHLAFQKAQCLDPTFMGCWLGQAIVAERTGHQHEALDLLRHVSQLGNLPVAYSNYCTRALSHLIAQSTSSESRSLADFHTDKMNIVPLARDCITKLADLYPTSYEVQYLLGCFQELDGLYRAAAHSYQNCLELLSRLKSSKDEYVKVNEALYRISRKLPLGGSVTSQFAVEFAKPDVGKKLLALLNAQAQGQQKTLINDQNFVDCFSLAKSVYQQSDVLAVFVLLACREQTMPRDLKFADERSSEPTAAILFSQLLLAVRRRGGLGDEVRQLINKLWLCDDRGGFWRRLVCLTLCTFTKELALPLASSVVFRNPDVPEARLLLQSVSGVDQAPLVSLYNIPRKLTVLVQLMHSDSARSKLCQRLVHSYPDDVRCRSLLKHCLV